MNQKIIYERQGGPEVISLIEVPEPVPGRGEVKIRILVSGAAYGDILPRRGVALPMPKFPYTPGYDVVGVVVENGPDASQFTIGTRVAALPGEGGYQQFLCMPESELVAVPEGLADEKAVALILNYVTAYQLLVRSAALKEGQSAFLYGLAGGVGTAATQVAKQLGIAIAGTASGGRLATLDAAGATVFDRNDPDLVRTVLSTIPDGLDAVFDPIGGKSLDRSFSLLGQKGVLVICGAASAAQTDANPKLALLGTIMRMLALRIRSGSRRVTNYAIPMYKKKYPAFFRMDVELLLRWLKEGKIDPEIAEVAPLREAARVQDLLERSAVSGKIVFRV